MKLKLKINLYTSVIFIVLLIAINSAIYMTFSKTVLNNELERTTAETMKTANAMNDSSPDIKMGDLLRAYLPVNGMFKIVNTAGKSMTTITDPDVQHLNDYPTTFSTKEMKDIVKVDRVLYVMISVPIILEDGTIANLQLIESLEGTGHVLDTLKYVLMIVTIVAMFPVLLSSQLLSNVISKPILSMIQTMSEIQKSGKHKQIPLPKQSKDELYEMAQTFNLMIERLEQNYEKQELFVMNASHELKTPLTIIESYSDLLKRRGMTHPDLFEESVEAIHSEAIRMRELTQQLLMLAKTDAKWTVQWEDISLEALIEEVTRHFQSGFQCTIQLQMMNNSVVRADKPKLKQLVYVFIENACKYSEGDVEVIVSEEQGTPIIIVKDHGIGIPAEDLDKIFERFHRVDKARARKTGGFGLGLAIAKELADAMNIELKVESEEGKGTTVKMKFTA